MKWDLPIKDTTGSTINEICGSENGHVPKIFRDIHTTQETSNYRHDVTVLTFRYTILFKGIGIGKLLENPIFVKANLNSLVIYSRPLSDRILRTIV